MPHFSPSSVWGTRLRRRAPNSLSCEKCLVSILVVQYTIFVRPFAIIRFAYSQIVRKTYVCRTSAAKKELKQRIFSDLQLASLRKRNQLVVIFMHCAAVLTFEI